MVQIIPNGSSVYLESTFQITEGVANIVKTNKKNITKLAKELNLEFHISKEESGNYALRVVNTTAYKTVSVADIEQFNETVKEFTNAIEKNDFHENVPAQAENNAEEVDVEELVHKIIGDKTPFTLIRIEKDCVIMSGNIPAPMLLPIILEQIAQS